MQVKVLTKASFGEFVKRLLRANRVIGVKRKENKFAFAELAHANELALDYDVTLASPKALFQPPRETLLTFAATGTCKTPLPLNDEPFVLLGIHTYDLRAINQMDKIWADKNADEQYFSRRSQATIIAIEPTRASKWSFWSSMNSARVEEGFDLLLTDIGGSYAIDVGSKKGERLLKKYAPKSLKASKEDLEAQKLARKKLASLCDMDRSISLRTGNVTDLVRQNYEHPVWEELAKKCYSCGSCNFVCPTCYCFDVKDELTLDLKDGERIRQWDGCLLKGFASVASGENFRGQCAARFRHRIYRKTVYVFAKIGELACVGCGRCSEACLPDITDPVKVINKIAEGA